MPYWRKIFETAPLPILVVDADVTVLDCNPAAESLLGKDREVILKRKGGEVLHCVHNEAPGGCGGGPDCQNCVIRQAVGSACLGTHVSRQRTVLERVQDGKIRILQMLVTSTPFEHEGRSHVLLMLEDVSELMALRGLLPICARCKKIRDDKRYWHQLEQYCHENLSLEFTHSICPDCAHELYGHV